MTGLLLSSAACSRYGLIAASAGYQLLILAAAHVQAEDVVSVPLRAKVRHLAETCLVISFSLRTAVDESGF